MANVLVVDDEKSIRITLREFLKDAHHTVVIAEDAMQAMDVLTQGDFDVVVADIRMPRITGLELLDSIKQVSPHVEVILMTGEPTIETAAHAVRAGAFDYLSKPVRREQVVNTVANAARVKALDAERQRLAEENREHRENLERLVREQIEEIRENEQKYRLLADNASDVIWTANADLEFTYFSPSVERLRGFTVAEAMAFSIQQSMTADSRDVTLGFFRDAMQAVHERDSAPGVVSLELQWVRKDGSTVWTENSIRILTDDDFRPTGILGIARDITERRTAEAQLLHSRKLEAVGRLAGGIAHDFNNMLTAVIGHVDLTMPLLDDGEVAAALRDIREIAANATDLTGQLLAFARRQIVQPVVMDPNDRLASLVRMLRPTMGETIKIALDCRAKGHIRIDRGQFEQLVMNLAVNAREAMPDGGLLLFETCDIDLNEAYAESHVDSNPGPCVRVTVTDTGNGMDEETRQQAFEPFFTTGGRAGTGLGLATCHGIALQAGGHIWIYSEPGKGTSVKVYFPLISDDVDRIEPGSATEPRPVTGERILVVEDDVRVRKVCVRTLQRSGYDVLQAGSLADARRIVAENVDLDAIVTDVVLPDGLGSEFVVEVLATRPDMPVLYVSGYTENEVIQDGVAAAGWNFLQKPYTPTALISALQHILPTAEPGQ